MSYDFELSCTLSATPEAIYDAWLDSAAHSAMTGGEAEASKTIGAPYSAWDGYITGKNIELTPGRRIVQTWRTTRFLDEHPDSTLTISLTPTRSGTLLMLSHCGVPDGQTAYEEHGWRDFYFEPMKAYFAGLKKSAKTADAKAVTEG